MDYLEVVLLVCLVTQPDACEERYIPVENSGTLAACMWQSQPYIAEWSAAHPKYTIKKWHCGFPQNRSAPI